MRARPRRHEVGSRASPRRAGREEHARGLCVRMRQEHEHTAPQTQRRRWGTTVQTRCECASVRWFGAARVHWGAATSQGRERPVPPEHRIRSPAPPPHPPGHHLPVGRGQPQARAVAGAASYGAGASPPPRLGWGATAGLRLRTPPLLKHGREHDAGARKPD